MIVLLAEVVTWVLMMTLLITQVVLPVVEGRLLFPFFRRRQRARELELAEELLKLGDDAAVAQLEAELKARKQRIHDRRYGPPPPPVRGVTMRDDDDDLSVHSRKGIDNDSPKVSR